MCRWETTSTLDANVPPWRGSPSAPTSLRLRSGHRHLAEPTDAGGSRLTNETEAGMEGTLIVK
jgi:hypothetical protein